MISDTIFMATYIVNDNATYITTYTVNSFVNQTAFFFYIQEGLIQLIVGCSVAFMLSQLSAISSDSLFILSTNLWET